MSKPTSQYRVYCINQDATPKLVGITQDQGELAKFMRDRYITRAFTPKMAKSKQPVMVEIRKLGSKEEAMKQLQCVELTRRDTLEAATYERDQFIEALKTRVGAQGWNAMVKPTSAVQPVETPAKVETPKVETTKKVKTRKVATPKVEAVKPIRKPDVDAAKLAEFEARCKKYRFRAYDHVAVLEDYYFNGVKSEKALKAKYGKGLSLSNLLKHSKAAIDFRQTYGIVDVR